MKRALRCLLPVVLLLLMVACSAPPQAVTPTEESTPTAPPPTETVPPATPTKTPTVPPTEPASATETPTPALVDLDNISDLEVASVTLDGAPADLAWLPDNTLLAATDAGLLKLVFREGEFEQEAVGELMGLTHAAPSPDGMIYAIAGDLLRVDLQTGDSQVLLAGAFTVFDLSPNGQIAAVGEDRAIKLIDTASGEIMGQFQVSYDLQSLAFSTDGTLLAASGVGSGVVLYDVADQRGLNTLATEGSVSELVFSPDNILLAGAVERSVKLWFVISGENLITLDDPDGVVTGIAFHPANIIIATADNAGTVYLWDVITQEALAALETEGGAGIVDLAWSQDGSMLAAVSADGTLYVWSIR